MIRTDLDQGPDIIIDAKGYLIKTRHQFKDFGHRVYLKGIELTYHGKQKLGFWNLSKKQKPWALEIEDAGQT